ncbi:diguanylate cyclase (GGDEF)-like protein [Paenibacillus phyllosphaerae]|uniref:Diguanylate cyclase (GGDEF)-like protein n=1 Tax=Paenibacillus phyllosphaerae TaxID=274593 RepID=A0A7W5AXE1_9BACL|nr:diguanylate cyclase [Paenibacillus phyllosphaerae]MBB3110011.1 diguanylate cyclase (GGDEF)-like protein [Paenibacillus phyllosphaerae]
MTTLQWLAGHAGRTFATGGVMTLVMMMLFMAIRLHRMYRRNGIYRLLIGVLPVILIQQGMLLAQHTSSLSSYPDLQLIQSLLGLLSFIIINFVFMKLYTQPSSRLKRQPFILLGIGMFLAAGFGLLLNPTSLAADSSPEWHPTLILDLYGIAVILAILLNSRGIEQRLNYSASLIVYFFYHLTGLAERYVFEGSSPFVLMLSQWLPVIYYTLLFLLLFEWVVERLMTTFHSSITDGLTSLYNRRHFNKKAEQALREIGRIGIIFCDIDNFKRLNDTHGHHKADGVLKQVAEILKEETSGIGIAGRYGGEELLALVVGEETKPETVAEAIRARIEKETIVTVSIGVCSGLQDTSVEEIVKRADEAMYQSKTTGKNKVTQHHASAKTRSKTKASAKSSAESHKL